MLSSDSLHYRQDKEQKMPESFLFSSRLRILSYIKTLLQNVFRIVNLNIYFAIHREICSNCDLYKCTMGTACTSHCLFFPASLETHRVLMVSQESQSFHSSSSDPSSAGDGDTAWKLLSLASPRDRWWGSLSLCSKRATALLPG